ncbi:hypothetical protein [Legionella parisiensis]|uniref:Uncharacterized protein n=1 Tax=Legionella parisiensis TaxID=45071 RepID=A0A1E5JQZ2_9GAMM|nr:hypothetical protein [Legionella parisiensis]KTD41466.1 hypothetical protein Lpar_2783 [Legionella parisiensis]OEH46967.1 hypothetical protein lpari_02169 [Legionella parisiensis]STX76216.1 Uncharacterised protein [Legionella parisiensis]
MSIGNLRFFSTKPQSISGLASTIERNAPYYRIHSTFPADGLPTRGNFDRVTIEALTQYLSENKPLITYGGAIVLDDLLTGFLKDKEIENGKSGLIVGVAERLIVLSSLDLIPEEYTHEAIIESLPAERIVAYITELKDLLHGEIVRNHFAEVNSSLPPTVTLPEIEDSDFVHDVWESASTKDTLKK